MTTLTTSTPTTPFDTSDTAPTRSRAVTVALWIVTVATAGMFLMAGGLKLAGVPQMVQTFEAIGIGQWFRYLTGTIEVVSAVALLVPSLALAAAVTLLAATSFIAWARWTRG